jgi:hypothetical protein
MRGYNHQFPKNGSGIFFTEALDIGSDKQKQERFARRAEFATEVWRVRAWFAGTTW